MGGGRWKPIGSSMPGWPPKNKTSILVVDFSDDKPYDSEILYLEGRSRDQIDQLDALALELSKTDQQYRATSEQLQAFQYVEEESELVRQQEKTLKSELTLLRSKLANCETELLQCKNKIRLLMDEILVEQRKYSRQYDPNRQQLLERHLMCEVDRLQVEIDLAVQSADQANKAHEKLKGEVAMLEGAIADKKKQVEKLVHEMKEVNLQSLAVVPPAEEVRHLLEVGSVKPGSTRRMIGSPRQLENAVPTSKNPHGVWV
ncbi:ras association domain-containing protein 8-like [Anopheles ziemanni]|uniref:ras association domain-containing protein 8-like n=1 Tax=Anopheles ziemanni TaxID=345580 RepID=UPI00265F6188|nr:ras association domain-containing protein 8-like [Anopheles ziemanni]